MYQLDDKFLEELGLGSLPEEQKQAFLDHVMNQLEIQVGTKLSDGLSEAQLEEFESFVDRDESRIRAWLAANVPDYVNDPTFRQLKESASDPNDELGVLAEFASMRWLGLNRPDYREVVQQVLDDLKKEIASNRDAILGSA